MEKNINEIKWLSIDELHPHPDNPRKDLGDLSELSESIKAKGVMQNLTVVKSQNSDGYTVIIGHRRTEAARLAGLTELPCIVADMTPAEQVQTMLLENMQRSDLTAYEQAQGFQMMLDFGDSIEDLSVKTGFSKTTIRKRLKMAELDGKTFKDISSRQFTFDDIDKLEKIEDISTRNLVLASIGTKNFENEYKKAIEAQAAKKRKAGWQEIFERHNLIEIEYSKIWDSKYASLGYVEGNPNEDKVIEMTEKYSHVYFAWGYNGIPYFRADKVYTEEENEEIRERERQRAAAEERRKSLSNLTKRAYQLRYEFVKDYPLRDAKRNLEKIIEWMYLKEIVSMSAFGMFTGYYNSSNCTKRFGELYGVNGGDDFQKVYEMVQSHPEKALLWIVYSQWCDSEETGCYDYNNMFKENPRLNHLYKGLESIGYEMSDEESAMINGTLELFVKSDDSEDSEDEIDDDFDDCDRDCENCPDQDICDEYDATLLDEPDEILEKLKQFSEEEEDE